jgi:hypothetical protein
MAKDTDEATNLMPQGPKPTRFDVVETAVLKVDRSYGTPGPLAAQVVAQSTPPEHPGAELRDEIPGGRMILRDSQSQERVSVRVKNDGASMRLTDAAGHVFGYLGSIDNAATLSIGGDGSLPGRVLIRGGHYQDRVQIWTTTTGAVLRMLDSYGKPFAYLGDDAGVAELALGGDGRLPGKIVLRNGHYQDQIVLDGESGDIMLMNADCAEYFTVEALADGDAVDAGTVLVLADDGPASCWTTRVPTMVVDRSPWWARWCAKWRPNQPRSGPGAS